jgi:hypothetical protein
MESVFARMRQSGVQALALGPGGLLFQGKSDLAKMALAHRIPTCGWSRETLVSGLLLSYGPDLVQIVRHAATFVDKIFARCQAGRYPCPTTDALSAHCQSANRQGAEGQYNILVPSPRRRGDRIGISMSFAQRRLQKIAVAAAFTLPLLIPLSVSDSAVAQTRAGQTGNAPACFDVCSAQYRSSGGNGATCSRSCYARCSGINGNIDNRH